MRRSDLFRRVALVAAAPVIAVLPDEKTQHEGPLIIETDKNVQVINNVFMNKGDGPALQVRSPKSA